jgi:hypothetical protein
MRLATTVAVTAAVLLGGALGASARSSVDIYIRGTIVSRVAGENAAIVDVRWDYKCLGDKLGEATYEWTLKAVRLQPKPETSTTLMRGTTKRGSIRVRLRPGFYSLVADPFICQTERGAGSTEPEIGKPLVVPDYCAWSVVRARGVVAVEQRNAVKRLAARDLARAGDVVFTEAGLVELTSYEGSSRVQLPARSRLRIDASLCGREGGWRLELEQGSVVLTVAERAARRYELVTANATVSARRAVLDVAATRGAGPRITVVSARSGTATVTARGRSVTVRRGLETRVVGTGAPSRPR